MHLEVELLRFLHLKNRRFFSLVFFILIYATINACTSLFKTNPVEPNWMSYDEENKSVHFELVAAWNSNNNGYNYNGYFKGDVTIKVPADWLVSMTFINLDGSAPHSILVTNPYTTDDIPDELTGEFAVLSRAYTDSIFANETTTMKFKAKKGHYWLFCGDKGHGINDMWIKFTADTNIKTPFIETEDVHGDVRH